MSEQCKNLQSDRAIGAYWEKMFASLASERGFSFTPHQIGRENSAVAESSKSGSPHFYTLPDITIWTSPGQHHEIKHKYPTRSDEFGLEVYRFEALRWFRNETRQSVYYTIHDYGCSERKHDRICRIEDWKTASIGMLLKDNKRRISKCTSYIAGKTVDNVDIFYWPVDTFKPLSMLWDYVLKKMAA